MGTVWVLTHRRIDRPKRGKRGARVKGVMCMHEPFGENTVFTRTFGPFIAFAISLACFPEARATCLAHTTASADAGRWTSGQLSTSKAAPLVTIVGMRCSAADLSPGADTQITATIKSANGFRLLQPGVDAAIDYVTSADHDGANSIPQNGAIDFMAAAVRNMSTTDAKSDVAMPISFRSFRGHRLAPGTYADVLTIEWRWRNCERAAAINSICKAHSTGSATTTFSLSMQVDARPPVVTITAKTTTGMESDKGFPASRMSRRIITVAVNNPDVVAIDPDSIVLNIPIDRHMLIADHVDGNARSIAVVRGAEDGMRVAFGGLQDASDDVECTADGVDWTLQPSDPTQIRSVRIRVRGTLQPGKSVAVALIGTALD